MVLFAPQHENNSNQTTSAHTKTGSDNNKTKQLKIRINDKLVCIIGDNDDFLILRIGFKKILFGWTNWFEGEIKCSNQIFEYLESELKLEFEYGKPTSLKPFVISTYRIQSLPLFLVKKLNLLKN